MKHSADSNLSHLLGKIDEAIGEHLLTGEPSTDEVSRDVIDRHDAMIRKYGYALAIAQVRNLVSTRLRKADATRKGQAAQQRLPLEFSGVGIDTTLTFQDRKGVVRYVSIARATASHHQAHLKLLASQINADTKKLTLAKGLYAYLKPAFKSHPGITTAEAIEILDPPARPPKTGDRPGARA